MLVKLFVIGRPGCGKSNTSIHIREFVKAEGWVTQRFKDYDILSQMAQNGDNRLRITERGGYDVFDTSAFDEALLTLEKNVLEYIEELEYTKELVIIELARGNYDVAFKQFSPEFLQDAYFLLIDADFDTCKERIKKRIASAHTPGNLNNRDNHDVSDFAMNTYYQHQYKPTNTMIMQRLYRVQNDDSWDDFTKKIENFIKDMLKLD